MWTGWTDERIEGIFIDPNTGEILDRNNSYAPFSIGQPNGEEAENCVYSTPYGNWRDVDCSVTGRSNRYPTEQVIFLNKQ